MLDNNPVGVRRSFELGFGCNICDVVGVVGKTKRQKYWGYYGTLEDQHENDPRRNEGFDCDSKITRKT